MTSSPPTLGAVPDSPYAAELERGASALRFGSPALEAEYVRGDLLQARTLIRVTCALAVLLPLLRGVELTVAAAWHSVLLIDFALVMAGSIALAAISWSSSFERSFIYWARIIVPVRNAIVAVHLADAAAHGQADMLMVLPLLLFGPYFLLRLPFRTAVFSSVLVAMSYVASAILFQLQPVVALRTSVFLLLGTAACAVAAQLLERSSRTAFLEGRIVAELAQHDALTGAKNRRVFDEYLGRLWPQAVKDRRTIAILLIDVDHFKAYNDRYGHQAGDQALCRVAQTVQTYVRRPLDVLARYGGEEFAAILYDVDGRQAADVAEQIRRAAGELAIEHDGLRTDVRVTISVGVGVMRPTASRNPRGALQLADQALYRAKALGRNRVELMEEADYGMLVTGAFSRESLARR